MAEGGKFDGEVSGRNRLSAKDEDLLEEVQGSGFEGFIEVLGHAEEAVDEIMAVV